MAAEKASPEERVAMAKAYNPEPLVFSYSEKEAILYALGVGVSTSQPDYLNFLFESAKDFKVVPSYGVITCFDLALEHILKVPAFKISLTKLLHGEQYLELYKPLPRSAKLKSYLKIADVVDKVSGLSVVFNVETFDESGEKVVFNQFVMFIVGAGNFEGRRTTSEVKNVESPPSRSPDAVIEEKTSIDQAALYRLSGDTNPLHIDPSFSAKGGFKTPILHGLCTFGYAVRHVMAKCANNDMSLFKAVKVRFTNPVLPGQTLRTEMWKDGNRVFFKTKTIEEGTPVISGAYVDLHEKK